MWTKEKVLKLRLSLDLTQKEFADMLGCRQQTVSEWEVGVYEPANAYGKLLDQVSSQKFMSRPLIAAQKKLASEPAPAETFEPEFADYIDKGFDPAID